MTEESENIFVDEDFVDPEKNPSDSYRMQTRRTESYSSYTPNKNIGKGMTETDPFLSRQSSVLSSKSGDKSNSSNTGSWWCMRVGNGKGGACFRLLPVIFICFMFSVMFFTFDEYYLDLKMTLDLVDYGVLTDSTALEVLFTHFIVILLVISYMRLLCSDPGTIPDNMDWNLGNDNVHSPVVYETKRSGGRRYCKWCQKFKPDRTRHCKTCNRCTLKMDHHCPWASNCVGWGNYKFFFLSLFYADLLSLIIAFRFFKTAAHVLQNPPLRFRVTVFVVSTELLAIVLSIVFTTFIGFHIILIWSCLTTIEFFEKYSNEKLFDASIWSEGVYANFKAALGKNPLLWLIPCKNLEGDGVTFSVNRKSKDQQDDMDQPQTAEEAVFNQMSRNTQHFKPEVSEDV